MNTSYMETIEVNDIFPTNIENESIYAFAHSVSKESTLGSHGIHKYPAKFIPQIPRWGINYLNIEPGQTILDPFCGSGTTLLEAQINGISSIGIDINPLAVLISKAKVHSFDSTKKDIILSLPNELVLSATNSQANYNLEIGKESENLHWNWNFWFPENLAIDILKLRDSITSFVWPDIFDDKEKEHLQSFFLVCLSSIIKAGSYLDENQIKVKLLKDKFINGFPNLSDLFLETSYKAINNHFLQYSSTNSLAPYEVLNSSANSMPLEDQSIDHVITSPPYINAIDYTMAHKFNNFFLTLITPSEFKNHCRDYIGMTERAVKVSDYIEKPGSIHPMVDDYIQQVWNTESKNNKNRSFVMWQYFSGMRKNLEEIYRVLKPNGAAIMVIGDNEICGVSVPTADLVIQIAQSLNFDLELKFYHEIRNVSSMRLNRNKSGGKIKHETIFVIRRPI